MSSVSRFLLVIGACASIGAGCSTKTAVVEEQDLRPVAPAPAPTAPPSIPPNAQNIPKPTGY